MAKSITTGRASVKLPKEFVTPITVVLCGDDDADANETVQAWRNYEQKLINFAKHLAVPIDGPSDVIALIRTLAPVANIFPGFQIRCVKKRGAKLKKDAAYYWQLAVAYEMARQKDPRLTKTSFAKQVGAAIINPEDKRVSGVIRAQIEARAAQIKNDNETLNTPALRQLAEVAVGLFQQQLTSSEIAERLEHEAETIINNLHKI